ncbi:MAG: hypothetical protein WB805_15605 [Candidatus Dormiibacterota bacterium]
MDVNQYVRSFAVTLQAAWTVVADQLGASNVPPTLAGLLGAVIVGRVDRKGVVNGVTYSVHGRGCRLQLAESGVVDIDLDDGGVPFFDAWRVQRFVSSFGVAALPESSEIESVCQALVLAGELNESAPGRYSIDAVT